MKQLGKILGLLLKRWTSKSPKLYEQITNYSIWVGMGCLIAIEFTPAGWVTTGLTILGSTLIAISGGSKLTTTDEEIIKETKKVFKNSNK